MLSIKLVTILLALTPAVHPCRFANCVTNLAKMALVPKSTSVKYVIPIVTEFKTVPSTCFIAVNVTGDCRRRRAFTEKPIIISLDDEDAVDIDDILPTLPRLEASVVAGESSAPDIQSSRKDEPPVEKETHRGWTFTANLAALTRNRWMTNPGFGVTYVSLQTSTLTSTIFSTVTSGQKAFMVSGCLPAGFVYAGC